MELFRQALIIMLLGMGLVFVFLALVILCVQGVARVVRWRESRDAAGGGRSPAGADDGRRVAVVIAVALGDGE